MSVALPTNRIRFDSTLMRRTISALESTTCHAVWVNDHLASFPAGTDYYPYSPTGDIDWDPHAPQYEALSVCAFAAALSRRMLIGTAVLTLPQRHPIEVAKVTSTLADLSDGRFVLGVGAGWSRREMRLLGWDPGSRGARLDEQIAVLRAAWSADAELPTLVHYSLPGDIILEPSPRPAQIPPILVGGVSPAAMRRVRRLADGWLAVSSPQPDQLRSVGRRLADIRRESPRYLRGVLKVPLPSPRMDDACAVIERIAGDGWDDVCFEFDVWDLDAVCELVGKCTLAGGER